MSIMFGHMSNLVLQLFSGPPLPLTFVSQLKNVYVVNNINIWTNGPLAILTCCPNVIDFVDVTLRDI